MSVYLKKVWRVLVSVSIEERLMAHSFHLKPLENLNCVCGVQGLQKTFLFLFFCLFKVPPTAYGISQSRSWIGAIAMSLYHSYSNVGSELHLNATAHCNAGSLTYRVRPGMETASPRILVGFLSCWVTTGTHRKFMFDPFFGEMTTSSEQRWPFHDNLDLQSHLK